jgi:hypothetical protein
VQKESIAQQLLGRTDGNGGIAGKLCIKKVLLSNCLAELMELHQETEEEGGEPEPADNWFSLSSAQRICGTLHSSM